MINTIGLFLLCWAFGYALGFKVYLVRQATYAAT